MGTPDRRVLKVYEEIVSATVTLQHRLRPETHHAEPSQEGWITSSPGITHVLVMLFLQDIIMVVFLPRHDADRCLTPKIGSNIDEETKSADEETSLACNIDDHDPEHRSIAANLISGTPT